MTRSFEKAAKLQNEKDFVAAIKEALASIERGDTVSSEEVRGMIPKWIAEAEKSRGV